MPDKLIKEVRASCLDVIRKKGWLQFEDISVSAEEYCPAPCMAYIRLDNRQINITLATNIKESWDKISEKHHIPVSFDQVLQSLVYFVIVHEHSHHMVCPRSKEWFESILQGSYEAIKGRVMRREAIRSICHNVMNMFSDTVINSINANSDPDKHTFRDGLFYTYLLDSIHAQRNGGPFRRKITKGMYLFLSVNAVLCKVNDRQKRCLDEYAPTLFPGYPRYLGKLLSVFTDSDETTREILSGDYGNMGSLLERLQDKSLWYGMSMRYAEIMYPFIKQPHRSLDNSFVRNPQAGSSGAQGSQHQGGQQEGEKTASESQKDEKKQNESTDKGESGQKDPVQEFMDGLEGPIKNHIPLSSKLLSDYKTLDKVYRKRAGRVTLDSDIKKQESSIYEKYVSSSPASIQEFDHKRIDWSSSRIINQDGGKIFDLHEKDLSLDFDFGGEIKQECGLPDLAFVFDSSISMKFHPFDGEGSGGYHFAVLAFYSIIKDLEMRNIAHLLRYNLINFSLTSVVSGWQPYSELDAVKKVLFDYQGSGTILKPEALREMRVRRQDNCIIIMLSDTHFNTYENHAAVLKETEDILGDPGVSFHLFQMESHSPYSLQVQRMGGSVIQVNSAEDFLGKSLKFTQDLYGHNYEVHC